jgi:chemotaxis protein methyltransferase CheR
MTPFASMTEQAKTQSYEFLRNFIAKNAGIELGADRHYLIEGRLEPVMAECNLKSLAMLCNALERESNGPSWAARGPDSVWQRVVHALTTHETSFFRDPAIFDSLRRNLIPRLLRNNSVSRFRAFSAAASSGQEVYSLAMLFAEMGIYPPPEIFATDISSIVLETAKEGCYTDYELSRGVEPALREKYFRPKGTGAQVSSELRKMVEFRQMDLRQSFGDIGRFDLVLCRNVLIYFDEPTRRDVLISLRDLLREGGILLLGGTETIWGDIPGLQRESEQSVSFYVRGETP